MDTRHEDHHDVLRRRSVLRAGALGAAGIAAAALIGCGGDDDDEQQRQPDSVATSTAAAGIGKLVPAPGLPYPYSYPEPTGKPPKAGGTLVAAATWDVADMDTTKSTAGGTITVPNTTSNRLLGFASGPDSDPLKLTLEPELAKSWERSPDGLTLTFQIAPNVKWQNVAPLNGRKFTAADVVFAYKRYASEGAQVGYFVDMDSINAVDDSTVRITLKRAAVDFLYPLGSRVLTIFPRETVEDGSISKVSIGTGPMILKELKPSSNVTFVKNPDYFERPVLLDGFEFRIMVDAAARLGAFRAGQIATGNAIADKASEVKRLVDDNPQLQVNANQIPVGTGHSNFGMSQTNPKFQDVRVRRAVSMSYDRAAIIKVMFEGFGVSGHAMPWFLTVDKEPAATDLGPWVKYDPTQARQLLSAAGQENLVINSVYYRYADAYTVIADVLTDQMRSAGITLNSRSLDYTSFNSQWTTGKLEEASTSAWAPPGFSPNDYFYGHWHSSSPGNRLKIKDARLDEWAEAQRFELDPQKRRDIFKKMWDHELDVMYRPPLATQHSFVILQPWLRGVRFGGQFGTNTEFYDWGDQLSEAWIDK